MHGGELVRRYTLGERDFAGVDLTNAELAGVDLTGIILNGATLVGADLVAPISGILT